MAVKRENRNIWMEKPDSDRPIFRVPPGLVTHYEKRGYVKAKAPVADPIGIEPKEHAKPGPKPKKSVTEEIKTPDHVDTQEA